MQIDNVFLNVSKGQAANKDDLLKCFKTDDRNAIILEILKKGEMQVGEKERSSMLEGMYRDIATTVAEKCVNPETKRPYTVTMIEKAMADLHLSVNPSRSAKSQALDVIKQLLEKKTIPIARAQMRIRIVVSSKDGKRIKEKLMTMIASKEDEDLDENYEWVWTDFVSFYPQRYFFLFSLSTAVLIYCSVFYGLTNQPSVIFCNDIRHA